MKKGQWRILESIISIVIIMSFLLIITSMQGAFFQSTDMSVIGYEKLRDLDIRGQLRDYAVSNDVNGLENDIDIKGYNHTVQICDYAGTCNGSAPSKANVWLSTYLISGSSVYDPKEIKLFIYSP